MEDDHHKDDTKALWDASGGFHYKLILSFEYTKSPIWQLTVGETWDDEHRLAGTLTMPLAVGRNLYHLLKAGCTATGHKSGIELVGGETKHEEGK
jgi:hypothetical protein